MSNEFHALRVHNVNKETEAAKKITFELNEEQLVNFKFIPGQYLTLELEINGKKLRRAYSICSAVEKKNISILVKRLSGGLVSNYINDNIKAGDLINVLPPEGKFKINPDPDAEKAYYFFAAGSGITPIISMISSIIEEEPKSTCYLLYGNKDENNIIFKDELDLLQNKYKDQFFVDYTLSKPIKEKKGGLSGIFSKSKTLWSGSIGRISRTMMADFVGNYSSTLPKLYFICGPNEMIVESHAALLGMGIEKKIIKREYFFSPDNSTNITALPGYPKKREVTVKLEGINHKLTISDNTTILQSLLDEGAEPTFSCMSGACSTCIAKVTSGSVSMDSCFALDEDEIEEGFILTCQAHPTSETVTIDYDV